MVQQLEQAITLACTPSPSLAHVAKEVARNSAAELATAQQLRDAVGMRLGVAALNGGGGAGTASATLEDNGADMMTEAIEAASGFMRLAGVGRRYWERIHWGGDMRMEGIGLWGGLGGGCVGEDTAHWGGHGRTRKGGLWALGNKTL